MDATPFQEFTIDCIGDVIPPHVEFQEKVEKRKKQNKAYVWKYKPEEKRKEKRYFLTIFLGGAMGAIHLQAGLAGNPEEQEEGCVPVGKGGPFEQHTS